MDGPPTGESVSGQYLYYIDVMNDMLAKRMTTLSVDFSHVLSYDGVLAHEVESQMPSCCIFFVAERACQSSVRPWDAVDIRLLSKSFSAMSPFCVKRFKTLWISTSPRQYKMKRVLANSTFPSSICQTSSPYETCEQRVSAAL